MSDHARTWRADGRLVYAELPAEADRLIGVMDSQALAAEAVAAHNERRARILSVHQADSIGHDGGR